MKCCVSTDVGTWTNWLTFEPDPDHSPDAGTGLLSPISYKLGILLRRENPMYTYWRPVAAAKRGFKMFFSPSRGNTFVGGTCALPSALLVLFYFTSVLSLLSRRSRQRERGFMQRACPSVRLSVAKIINAIFSKTKHFRAMISIDDL